MRRTAGFYTTARHRLRIWRTIWSGRKLRKPLLRAREASRLSATLGIQTYYYAVRLEDRSVIRVAQSTESSLSTLLGCVPYVILIMVLVFLAAIGIGRAQVKRNWSL